MSEFDPFDPKFLHGNITKASQIDRRYSYVGKVLSGFCAPRPEWFLKDELGDELGDARSRLTTSIYNALVESYFTDGEYGAVGGFRHVLEDGDAELWTTIWCGLAEAEVADFAIVGGEGPLDFMRKGVGEPQHDVLDELHVGDPADEAEAVKELLCLLCRRLSDELSDELVAAAADAETEEEIDTASRAIIREAVREASIEIRASTAFETEPALRWHRAWRAQRSAQKLPAVLRLSGEDLGRHAALAGWWEVGREAEVEEACRWLRPPPLPPHALLNHVPPRQKKGKQS